MQLQANLPLLEGSRALERASRVHLVGIAGTGVRGLVPIFLARGMKVTGSDVNENPLGDQYRAMGVICTVGHCDGNVGPGTDVVLISAAVELDNPEVLAAARNRIPVIKYSQGLGYLMAEKQGIAVAGTHGKTTTTAMVSHVLLESGKDPSFVIGGEYAAFGGSSRSGKGPHFVAEACEFDRSFLNLRPAAAIVTNIEEEHLDYFASLGEIQHAFAQFAALLPPAGLLVVNADDVNSSFLKGAAGCRVETFSFQRGGGDWWAQGVETRGEGTSFTLRSRDGRAVDVRMRVPGEHNVKNALAAAVACSWAGVPLEAIAQALGTFTGVRRRFDVLAREPVTVIDDYAHHPTEVDVLIRAARRAFPEKRLVGVFQPHQYARLRRMLDRFSSVLAGLEVTIVTSVYRSRDREDDVLAVDAASLVEGIRARGGTAHYAPDFADVVTALDGVVERGDVALFMGAGNVTRLAHSYAQREKRWRGSEMTRSG